MSLTHYTGLNGQNAETDNVLVWGGSPTYTTDVPGDSLTTRSLELTTGDTARLQWLDGDTQVEKAGALHLHFRFKLIANNTDNDQVRIGIARDNVEVIAFSVEDSTALPTLRVAGSVVATAAAGGEATPGDWQRYLLSIEGRGISDVIRLYPNADLTATPLIEYTITAPVQSALAVIGNPNETRLEFASNPSSCRVTDIAVMDPDDGIGYTDPAIFARFSVLGAVFTGNGLPAEWTGGYEDIDELPVSDAEYIEAQSVDLQSAFTRDAVSALTDNVYALRVNINARRAGVGAGERIGLEADDGATAEVDAEAPLSIRDTVTVYHQAPPSGGAWTPLIVDSTTLSIYSRT